MDKETLALLSKGKKVIVKEEYIFEDVPTTKKEEIEEDIPTTSRGTFGPKRPGTSDYKLCENCGNRYLKQLDQCPSCTAINDKF